MSGSRSDCAASSGSRSPRRPARSPIVSAAGSSTTKSRPRTRPHRRSAGAVAPPLPRALLARRRATGFVGRADALARLHALWSEVVAGEQRLAVVAGEPGIGKTRLLAEFAAMVQATGAGVLYGRAEEDALLPYQPFADALRGALEWGIAVPDPDTLAAIVPGLTHRSPRSAISPEDPPAGRLRLFEAVRGSLEAAATARPLLLALDDLHWADRPTLRLLAYLARRQLAPVLLLGAYRQTELTQATPLFELLADVRRDVAVEEITLEGLGSGEVAALLAQTMRRPPDEPLLARVHAQTAGNPFFVEELSGHLQASADVASRRRPDRDPGKHPASGRTPRSAAGKPDGRAPDRRRRARPRVRSRACRRDRRDGARPGAGRSWSTPSTAA